MQFSSVVGHSNTKQYLISLVKQQRMPHAMIISGSKGNGALAMAIAYAQYIMCEEPTDTDSCGVCSNCAKFSKMQHIDVHYSFPVITSTDKKPISQSYIAEFRNFVLANPYADNTAWLAQLEAGTKQGNISAEECRSIISKLQLRSFEGGNKILIVWLPEFLGKEGNILLKFIEEPPDNTIMLFATENYDGILGTIQSRAQLVQLPPLKDVDIYNTLVQQHQLADSTASQIARIAEGNYYAATQLMSHASESYFQLFRQWMNVLFTNDGIGISNWGLLVAEQPKETQKQFLLYITVMMEHLIRIKWVGKENMLLHDEEQKIIEKLLSLNITEAQAYAIAKEASEATSYLERNANAKIVLQSLSLSAKEIFGGKPLYL
jgi:DNA polymerase III subunit delta'